MQRWIAGWKEQIHQEAMEEAFSDHHVVFKIHRNIKSSLRQTIKGKKPLEHFKHHLELCPGSIHPPSPASPPHPSPSHVRFSLRPPQFSQSRLLFDCQFGLPLFHSALVPQQVVCSLQGNVPLAEAALLPCGNVQRRRRGAERTNSGLMQFWHSALAYGAGCSRKTTTSHTRKALFTPLLPLQCSG